MEMASKKTPDTRYTEEQKEFLRQNIKNYRYPELTEVFNKHFGTNRNVGMIQDICLKRLKIKRDHPYVFFKGRKEFNEHPVGTEVCCGDILWIKVSNEFIKDNKIRSSKQLNPNWEKKHILAWEKHNGKVPNDRVIVFLDKNHMNCEIDNLYCTTRTVSFMMAKNKWYKRDKEQTLTAIKWCELFYTLKEVSE